MAISKICPRCQINKPFTCYSKDSNRVDQLNSWCKDCIRASRRELKRRYKEKDFLRWKADQFRSNWIRRAKQNGLSISDVPFRDNIKEWLETQQPFVCFYTGVALDNEFGVDHKVSIFRGGGFELDNLVITCPKINGAKGDLSSEEFFALLKTIGTWEDKGERLLRRLLWSNSRFQRSK